MYIDPTEVRASTYAAISIYLSMVFTLIGFSTPYWLATDGRQPVKHFENLGLWEACFTSFYHPNYLYDREYRGCHWIFNEDYAFLLNFLEPPFFIFTQLLFTIGFVLLLLAVIAVLAIQLCFVIEKEIYAMKLLAIDMSVAAFCCTTAVVIFGIWGDDRDWMPDPEHNFLSWSFALAVVGAFFQWVAACLFWIENRILYKKQLKAGHQNSYSLRSNEQIRA